MKVCKKCGIEKPLGDFGKSGIRLLSDGNLKQYYKSIWMQMKSYLIQV